MLSKSLKYAFRGVLYLSLYASEENKVMIKDISEPTKVPRAYMAKLLQELGRHDIVSSMKGPNGGFYLSEENLKTPLMKMVRIIDGENRINSCVLSLEKCHDGNPCPFHQLISPLKTEFIKKLETTTIKDLTAEIKKGRSFLPL